jgi:hypothetical protein
MSAADQVPDDVKKKFVEEVKLRGYDDKYIDRKEEKEILQFAIKDGISVDSARAALSQVCEASDYVLESRALQQVEEALQTFAENDGKVDEKEYADAVTICKKATKGKKTDTECKRFVLGIMEDRSYTAKTGWFSNWFKNEKASVGMHS